MSSITIFGTGHAMVTECYNTCFMITDEKHRLLVDAGGGNTILIQMKKSGISFLEVHDFFLTHAHTDHLLGAVWVVRAVATLMAKGTYEGVFKIHSSEKTAEILNTICQLTLGKKHKKYIGDRILFETIHHGEERQIGNMTLTFFDIGSTKMEQYGFRAVLSDG